ncbi:DgyrCDS27 [Dimorphilus gyrociliatus]|uniref:DgyrCDS27 n=1 Tax=Dimorphilus gyrociliatus TaxID=2664684 RepID=A0A7I8V5X4_9ANNE|nr:DgyrCDS27 [Dimorphilus gyrociliatus]
MPKSSSKPLIEKRRRARITQSMQQIRMIVDTATIQQNMPYKLERAEVLELAVDHMKKLPAKSKGSSLELRYFLTAKIFNLLEKPTNRETFTSGYVDCLNETLKILADERFAEVRGKLSVYVADALERRLSRSSKADLSDLQPSPVDPHRVISTTTKICTPQLNIVPIVSLPTPFMPYTLPYNVSQSMKRSVPEEKEDLPNKRACRDITNKPIESLEPKKSRKLLQFHHQLPSLIN